MHILIDYTQIPLQKTGVGVYGHSLICELSRIDRDNDYFVVIQDDDTSLESIANPRFRFLRVKARFFRKLPVRLLLEQVLLPFCAWKYKIDLVHSLHYSFPVAKLGWKTVVTLHDMTFLKFPHWHVLPKRHYFRLFITLAARQADRIILDSESSRRDFLESFPGRASKVKTVLLGKNEDFRPDIDRRVIDSVRQQFGIRGEYVLYLGTLEPRKNIPTLLRSFERLMPENPGLQLVIAGKKGWYYQEIFNLVRKAGLDNTVVFTGFVRDKDKPALLAGARLFVYPSFYEGFGIPVLEAMASGIPTITSRVSSLPEVAGDACWLIDPANSEELAGAIQKLLNDATLYATLRERALDRSRSFSWEKTARETLNIYKSMFDK